MPKNSPLPFRDEIGRAELPRTLKEVYAEALKLAHREFVHAQRAVQVDDWR